jgi:hypothetical protein
MPEVRKGTVGGEIRGEKTKDYYSKDTGLFFLSLILPYVRRHGRNLERQQGSSAEKLTFNIV